MGANLYEAVIMGANLIYADLRGADLRYTKCRGANFSKADFRGAHLRGANLIETILTGADLRGTIFLNSMIGSTSLGSLDLSEAIGLEDVGHWTPSTISTDTFVLSKGKIPEIFLRGCGLSDADIEYVKLSNPDLSNEEINRILYKIYDFRASQPFQISPLFVSYSHSDSAFVEKLEKYLNEKGVRFWRDVHDAKAGRLEKQIDRAIRQHPTVLLILSSNSIKSDWVEHEVRTARELEKEIGRDVLCPVALDNSWKGSRWPKRVMEQIMEYNILDFSAWKDDSRFGNTFNKLIDGLGLFYKE